MVGETASEAGLPFDLIVNDNDGSKRESQLSIMENGEGTHPHERITVNSPQLIIR